MQKDKIIVTFQSIKIYLQLTLEVLITTAADNILIFFVFFRVNKI